MSRLRDRLVALGTAASSSWLGGVFYHVVSRRIDRVLIPLSKGRLSMGPPGQTVLITTTGARTGRPRQASLAFGWQGEDMVVIASKGGAPHHPAWYHNLKADPRVRVQYPGVIEDRIARVEGNAEAPHIARRLQRAQRRPQALALGGEQVRRRMDHERVERTPEQIDRTTRARDNGVEPFRKARRLADDAEPARLRPRARQNLFRIAVSGSCIDRLDAAFRGAIENRQHLVERRSARGIGDAVVEAELDCAERQTHRLSAP